MHGVVSKSYIKYVKKYVFSYFISRKPEDEVAEEKE